MALPQDYKDLMRLYGFGSFLEFLGFNVPVSENFNVRFVPQARLICDSFQSMKEDVPSPRRGLLRNLLIVILWC